MKRLMIAAAAMTAGIALADVSSANIVGYINTDTVCGGQLISAGFLKPGTSGFNVSGITVSGYQEDTAFVDNNDFACDFYILDDAGRTIKETDKYFYYVDPCDWAGGFVGGKWYDRNDQEVVAGGDNDLSLSPAQAVWLSMPAGDGEHTITFGTAGEVIQAEIQFPLVSGGNCVGNPMAVPVNLSSLTVTGYQEDTAFVDNNDYACDFYILDDAGRTNKEVGKYFYYVDPCDWAGGFVGGKWYDRNDQEIVPGENDFAIPATQGLWFGTPAGDGEHVQKIIFPQVVGDQAVK